jgi:aryl-alcohol dehydrogenase-like predicted oxidoreductase
MPVRIVLGRPCAEYVLGGAQLGLAYGITNRSGVPDLARVQSILFAAIEHGLTTIDTAAAYGASEELIGAALADSETLRNGMWPITKLDPMLDDRTLSTEDLRRTVQDSIEMSLRRLRCQTLPLVMLHRPEHRTMAGGVVWETLVRFRDEGVVEHLGVSVYEPDQALPALADPEVEALQVQLNALDPRHLDAGVTDAAARAGTALFLRSVFLQGLLVDPDAAQRQTSASLRHHLARYRGVAADLGRTPRGLALAFARAVPGLSGLVIGAETAHQVAMNAALWNEPALTAAEFARVRSALAGVPESVTNPSEWTSA